MSVASAMAAYSKLLGVCVARCAGSYLPTQLATHTHNRLEYAAIVPAMNISTNTLELYL